MNNFETNFKSGLGPLQADPREVRLRDIALSAKRIMVPKSRDAESSVADFTARTGVEIPDTLWENEYVTSDGRSFRLVPGGDMPGQLDAGYGDLAICSTELIEESGLRRQLDAYRIGEPICRLSVLALDEVADDWQQFLELANGRYPSLPRELPSPFPRYLEQIAAGRDIPLVPQYIPISGKAEATMRVNGIGAVADRIVTGKTVKKIGGREVYQLANIYTEVIVGKQDATAY